MKHITSCLIPAVYFVLIHCNSVFAQCNPAVSDFCGEAELLCSLSELNGYSCTNTGIIPGLCSPICAQGGVAENTSWWGFITNGGPVSITMNVGNCSLGQGLEYGILKNCSCGEAVVCRSNPCIAPGTQETITANFSKCGQYFLWIDGCNADVCDFTLSTTGGGPPVIPTLPFINNESSGIIDNLCVGCYKGFSIYLPNDGCNYSYDWTLDGVYLTSYNAFEKMMNQAGEFQLCVTATIKNPKNPNSICAQSPPRCALLKVTKSPDRIGKPRGICYETAQQGAFKWHSQTITSSGIYRASLRVGSCCFFDSVVQFTILDLPVSPDVYYIGCDNKPFIDITGKTHALCSYRKLINLPKSTSPDKCDSSIYLTAVNVDYAPKWQTNCFGNKVEHTANVGILKPCDAGESYEFEYSWYKKSDPSKIISRDDRIIVDAVSEEYCLQLSVITLLNSERKICTKIFCETIDEANGSPGCFPLAGSKIYCFDASGTYRIDTLITQKVNFYTWRVTGGMITSNPDSSVVNVVWQLNPGDTGKICASYTVDCGTSCEPCLKVVFDNNIAGPDFSKRGLSVNLSALPHPNGSWRLISGPYPVRIDEPNNPRSRISAYNYGNYCFEWSITTANCTVRDTQCVELHYFQKTSPEYPANIFDFRNKTISRPELHTVETFTPNLIDRSGKSFVMITGETKSPVHYSWYDMYGRLSSRHMLQTTNESKRYELNTPVQGGFYYLVMEVNGIPLVHKICVID